MREMDAAAIAAGISGECLMDRAGRGVAAALQALGATRFLFVAGKGNNGGDAFAAARFLHEAGLHCHLWVAADEAEISGDARLHLQRLRTCGLEPRFLPAEANWDSGRLVLPLVDVVVDCLLGTGSRGAPRGVVAAAIAALAERMLPVVAVDLPSGLDADTGKVHAPCFRAAATLTLALPKLGFLNPGARAVTGPIRCIDIGLGDAPDAASEPRMVGLPSSRRRELAAHKGSQGRVLCLGGSIAYPGAIGLATRAALRSGAGLITVQTVREVVPILAGQAPEAMVRGELQEATWSPEGVDAVLAGPGMGTAPPTKALIHRLLATCRAPLVLDADALNILAGDLPRLREASCPLILTPHPGEMGRLLGISTAEVQADREAAIREAVAQSGACVVLKGEGTFVLAPDQPLHINLCGNPGLASGGTGDVLAGLLTGLLAQGLAPFDGACEAVIRHAMAGDRAAWALGQEAMLASDLLTRFW